MGKRIFIYVLWLLLFCMMSGQVIGQNKSAESHSHTCKTVLALKNNLLYDLALAPNIEVELPLGKRWSLNVEYKCPWWSDSGCNFCYQLLSGGTEARYWLGNRHTRGRLSGHFLGAYAEGGTYDFQLKKEKGYRGKYYAAAGITYGYVRPLARHLRLNSVWALDTWIRSTGNILLMEMTWFGSVVESITLSGRQKQKFLWYGF